MSQDTRQWLAVVAGLLLCGFVLGYAGIALAGSVMFA